MSRKPTYELTCAMLKRGARIDYDDVVREIGTSAASAHKVIRRLRQRQLVHVVEWRHKGRAPYYPVIAWGGGEDAKLVTKRNRPRIRLQTTRLLLDLLRKGETLDARTAHEKIPGSTLGSIYDSFQRLINTQEREVHICAWRRGSPGPLRPVLAYGGDKKDKDRPARLTNSARCRRYRKRLKSENPDQIDRSRARSVLRKKIKTGNVPHDPIVLILLGAASACP